MTLFLMLFAGLALLFFLLKSMSGELDPRYFSPSFDINRLEEIASWQKNDHSLPLQFLIWTKNSLSLNFGNSTSTGRLVIDSLATPLKHTVALGFLALMWGMLIAIPTATLAALKNNKFYDRLMTIIMVILYALPAYWIGLFLLNIFSLRLGLFPSSQLFSIGAETRFLNTTADYLHHLFLPSLTLGLSFSAYFHKYLRNKIIDLLDSEFIIAARSRGLKKSTIFFRHLMPNLVLILLTLLSTITPTIFSGTVTVEVVFSLPGLGRTMVNAATSRDIPLIMGGTTLAFICVLLMNSLLDFLIKFLNPQTRWTKIEKTIKK
jgi:peptide/nickel transport system permease protein